MYRRTIIRNVAITSVGLTGGCLSRVGRTNAKEEEKPGGDVLVRNKDDIEHRIRVNITSDSRTVFESELQLNPSDSKSFPDAFSGGAYNVKVELDGEKTVSHRLTIGECSAITLHVTITESEKIEIKQDYCD